MLRAFGCWEDRSDDMVVQHSKKATKKSTESMKKERLKEAVKGTKSILNFTAN